MSISKALVFEDCSKPETNLKSIIGTGTWDRLHSACWASVGVISYSALGHGTPPFLKTQSQRGMNYWFCYSDQLASLSSLTLCRPTITLKGIWQGKKSISTQASPPACTSSLKPFSLHQAQEVKGGRDINAYLMSPVTCFIALPTVTPDTLTSKGRRSWRLQNIASSPVIRFKKEVSWVSEEQWSCATNLLEFELYRESGHAGVVWCFKLEASTLCDRHCCSLWCCKVTVSGPC